MVSSRKLPDGTVTFLMTDIEGSTRLWERLGDDFIPLLEEHNRIVCEAMATHAGLEVKTEGDSFFYVFESARAAVAGAIAIQQALSRANAGVSVRVGVHTGAPALRHNDYFGPHVNRTARIRDAAHGGQILLSAVTYELCRDAKILHANLVDRGEHRLRDLGAPERLYQVVPDGEPPDTRLLRTLETRPNNLPAYRTSFVGRQRELGIVHELLLHASARLVTLTGPGGVGKTRLALQAAADHLVDFPDGVWFVPLGDVEDPELVLSEVSSVVLGAQMQADPVRDLAGQLAGKRALIVLDSFEHVLPAAGQLGQLLSLAPDLRSLVTSRSLLHLSGEHEFNVPSLADTDSVQLFIERAQSVRTSMRFDGNGLRTAALICQHLDGLPLAIELAAARVRGMTPPQIARRLERRLDLLSGGGRDMPDRQKTMRAVLDWSFDLLSHDDRHLFTSLAVFAGGFFLDAAEEVLRDGGALDGIFSLRDHSLLVATDELGETRYHMLTLVREYALSLAGDLAELAERHAAHYVRVAQEWGDRIRGPQQQQALARLDLEFANFEAAMRWAHEHDRPDMIAELATYLSEYAYTRGRITPAMFAYVQDAADTLAGRADTSLQADLLFALGAMSWMQRRFDEGEDCVNLSLKYFRANELHGRACRSLSMLGLIAADQGRLDLARQRFEEGLSVARDARCVQEQAMLLENLSTLELRAGNIRQARALAEQGLALNTSLHDEAAASYQAHTLGTIAWRQGERSTAADWMLISLATRVRMADHPGLARTFWSLAAAAHETGDPETAALFGLAGRRFLSGNLLTADPGEGGAVEEAIRALDADSVEGLAARVTVMPAQEIVDRATAFLQALS